MKMSHPQFMVLLFQNWDTNKSKHKSLNLPFFIFTIKVLLLFESTVYMQQYALSQGL